MYKDNDCEIRHITPAEGNVFADLGFAEDEAERLKELAEEDINQRFPRGPVLAVHVNVAVLSTL